MNNFEKYTLIETGRYGKSPITRDVSERDVSRILSTTSVSVGLL